jgi:tellurite methyltransferase
MSPDSPEARLSDHEQELQPSEFLVENIGLLRRGLALDIAMGSGRNAVYLAKMGFSVEGVDISEESLRRAETLAREAGVAIQVQVADLERDYVIPREAYDLIICFNYLQRSLVPQIRDGVKKGGTVVYETFIVDQVQFGRPRNPNFLLKYNELLDMFRAFRCLRYQEGIFENRKAIASLIAQKP